MEELQRILKEWLNFFFIGGRYHVVNTQAGPSFNDALIDFRSEVVSWRLANDRGQILLSFSLGKDSFDETDSYSLDLLFRLVEGQRLESAILTKEKAKWLEENIEKIEQRFSQVSLSQTLKDLKKLRTLRAKEMFG